MEQLGTIAPMIVFLVLIFVMMYFLTIKPQRRRQKEQQELLERIRRGEKVITSSGIYGQIESITDDTVVIKLESGATMRVAKGSVASEQAKRAK